MGRVIGIQRLDFTCDSEEDFGCLDKADFLVTYEVRHEQLGSMQMVKSYCRKHMPEDVERAWVEEGGRL